MRLSLSGVERFYSIWKPLLAYVNKECELVPEECLEEPLDYHEVSEVRDTLWANDSLRESFIAENPAFLSAADLSIVKSWQYRLEDEFIITRHLRTHSILINAHDTRLVYQDSHTRPLDRKLKACYYDAYVSARNRGTIISSLTPQECECMPLLLD